MVVAKYDNEIGHAYLKFLLQCEKVATELAPILISELEKAKARIAELEAKAKPIAQSRVKMIDVPVYDLNLFGEKDIVRYTKVPADSVSNVVQLHSRARHCNKVATGCLRRAEDIQRQLENISEEIRSTLWDDHDTRLLESTTNSVSSCIALLSKEKPLAHVTKARR